MKKIGIVIVNYNTYDILVKCVNSIIFNVKHNYTIYLVDNYSDKKIRESLKKKYYNQDNVKLILADTNLGYSGGNNLGCKCAIADGCDYIAIVNSDIEFKNDIISVMVQDIKRDVAVVGPKIVMLDGGDGQHLIRTYNYLDAVLDRYPFFVLKKWFNIGCVKRNTNYPEFFGMVSGCCFLIDAKCFEEIDFFDDNVFLYSEERILSIKLKEIGKKACYDNSAVVLHKEGKSTEKKGTPFSDYHRYISDYYTVIRYIKPSKLKLFFLKYIRLFIFRMKCIKNKDYNIQYKRLKTKMREVENGNYKITP